MIRQVQGDITLLNFIKELHENGQAIRTIANIFKTDEGIISTILHNYDFLLDLLDSIRKRQRNTPVSPRLVIVSSEVSR